MSSETPPEYLTTAEVAAILRVTINTLRQWRNEARGPRSFRVGGRVLYDRADLNAFIKAAQESD